MKNSISILKFNEAKDLFEYCEQKRKSRYGKAIASGKNDYNAKLEAHRVAKSEWNRLVHRLSGTLDFKAYRFFNANFSEFKFPYEVDFKNAVFYGRTNFYKSEFTERVYFDKARFRNHAYFNEATFNNSSSFEEVKFDEGAYFLKTTFSYTYFRRASFEEDTTFSEASFLPTNAPPNDETRQIIDFNEAIFRRDTYFLNSLFKIDTNFTDTRFHESVNFTKAEFYNTVNFQEASFLGFTKFRDTYFEKEAIFEAILSPRGFDLTKATFKILPDFVQAHFAEAPRLDGVKHGDLEKNWQIPQESNDELRTLTARFRALKRLALQNQDYELERLYFQGELSAMNNIYPRESWHGWMNWLYEKLSDFGRSFSRPLCLWLVLMAVSAIGYYVCSPAPSGNCIKIVDTGNSEKFNKKLQNRQTKPTPEQRAVNFDAYLASASLAFTNGVGFLGIGNEENTKQTYACLYGLNETLGGLHKQELIPRIPGPVTVLGAFQRAFSFLLLFLMALAVRNHFRISS
jgi:uncharacterized protein YjbI with pentapeptide repeats